MAPIIRVHEYLSKTPIHHDHMNVLHWRVRRCRHHHILRLQVLMYNTFGMAVSNGTEGVLHDLHHPTLVGAWILRQVGWQAFDEVLQVPSVTWFHDQVKVALILKILKYSEDIGVVQLLQHRKLLAHLVWWCSSFVSCLLADDLADPNDLFVSLLLKLVAHQIDGAEGTFSQLLLRIVDIGKPLRILLDELLAPIPVSSLTTL
mmetsp:Transcript_10446/g.18822  ORF Transcript_10446/g.18822 Transcript_10446/m.18822 type:complete len:203 (+) Transcript_10446:1155-1763(+)